MRLHTYLFVLLGLVLPLLASAQSELPTAPTGFHWQTLPEIKASVLAPEEWYFLNEPHPGVNAYFVTKQRIEGNNQFTTGLTLNAIRHINQRGPKVNARTYAAAFTQNAAERYGKAVIEQKHDSAGSFHSYHLRYRALSPSGGEARIIQNVAIANTATDTFYLLIFEAPEPEWETAWQKGELMLRQIVFNPAE